MEHWRLHLLLPHLSVSEPIKLIGSNAQLVICESLQLQGMDAEQLITCSIWAGNKPVPIRLHSLRLSLSFSNVSLTSMLLVALIWTW